jgi:uncharacterized protein (TIGR02453 family)
MISKTTFQFLSQLKQNNNKEWFDQNRPVYSQIRSQFELFVEAVIGLISEFDKEAGQTTAKASIFRINRDIRFSRDKMPYKTNLGAFIAQGGRKGIHAGYYIHVEPGSCFLAGGIYMPSGPMLKAIRDDIYHNYPEFKEIITAPEFRKHFGDGVGGEKLKSVPRGYPPDFEGIEYLKYKSYTVYKDEPDSLYQKPAFSEELKSVFRSMAPYNHFLNEAVHDL